MEEQELSTDDKIILELTRENHELKKTVRGFEDIENNHKGIVISLQAALANAKTAAQKAVNYLDHFTDFIPMGETYLKNRNEEGELGYEIQGYLNHLNDEHGFMPNSDKHF